MKNRGLSMSGVKRVCKTATKMALNAVVNAGLIGFVKGLYVGYLIGSYKAKRSWHNIKCTDKSEEKK